MYEDDIILDFSPIDSFANNVILTLIGVEDPEGNLLPVHAIDDVEARQDLLPIKLRDDAITQYRVPRGEFGTYMVIFEVYQRRLDETFICEGPLNVTPE